MWVFTKDGFFSIVYKDCGKNEILVKARSIDDLNNLCNKLDIKPNIITQVYDGYPYSVILAKDSWISYLTNYVYDIDYDNVRENIVPKHDKARAEIYQSVWTSMYNWFGREQPSLND